MIKKQGQSTAQRDQPLEANTLKQRKKQVLFSLQAQIFKKQTVGFCFLCVLFLCLLLCLRKDQKNTVVQVKPLCQRERQDPN